MNKILACIDTSPRAAHVLEAAIDLARRTQANHAECSVLVVR